MKKALTVTIAGILFTIEEDAYQILDQYIQSVKTYFSSYPDSAEIIKDIEARIAEKLLNNNEDGKKIITQNTVDELIRVMGKVEDFASAEESGESIGTNTQRENADNHGTRRLYRSTDDVVIAGVASGFAQYLNVDPLIMRLIFAALTLLTGGTAIVLYIILALMMPPAKTAAEKAQMRGIPNNLESFKKAFNKSAHEAKENATDIMKHSPIRSFLERLFRLMGTIVRSLGKLLVKLLSIIVTLATTFALVMLTFLFINLLFNSHSPLIEFPLYEVIGGSVYYTFVMIGYMVAVIPLVLIWATALYIIRRKRTFTYQIGLGLVGVWIVASIVMGTLAVRHAPEIHSRVESMPEFQKITRVEEFSGFNKIIATGGTRVTVVNGSVFAVKATGRQIDLDRTSITMKDGVLSTRRSSIKKKCIICMGGRSIDIEVTMPTLEAIEARGASRIITDPFTTPTLRLMVSGGSQMETAVTAKHVDADLSGVGRIVLSGTASSTSAQLSGAAYLNGQNFKVNTVTAELSGNARMNIDALDTLEVEAGGASQVRYYGMPDVDKELSGIAEVLQDDEDSKYDSYGYDE